MSSTNHRAVRTTVSANGRRHIVVQHQGRAEQVVLSFTTAQLPSGAEAAALPAGFLVYDRTTAALKMWTGAAWTGVALSTAYSSWSSGPATNVTFAVDGQNDGGWLIEFDITESLGNVVFTVQPNGVTANQYTRLHQFDDTPISTAYTTDLRFAFCTNGKHVRGSIEIRGKTGTSRQFIADVVRDSGSDITWLRYSGIWTDTSTPITTLVLHADTSNGFGLGSWATIRKIGNPQY